MNIRRLLNDLPMNDFEFRVAPSDNEWECTVTRYGHGGAADVVTTRIASTPADAIERAIAMAFPTDTPGPMCDAVCPMNNGWCAECPPEGVDDPNYIP